MKLTKKGAAIGAGVGAVLVFAWRAFKRRWDGEDEEVEEDEVAEDKNKDAFQAEVDLAASTMDSEDREALQGCLRIFRSFMRVGCEEIGKMRMAEEIATAIHLRNAAFGMSRAIEQGFATAVLSQYEGALSQIIREERYEGETTGIAALGAVDQFVQILKKPMADLQAAYN